jgi:putative ABC transport system permease protein
VGKKALYKDIYKEIMKSKTRFLSIMLMIGLGSFVFVGLYVTGPTMRHTLLTYADHYNLADLTVTSPIGLAKADKQILAALPGVTELEYAYRTDARIKDTDVVVRVESLGQLPGYEISQGRLPMAGYELALDSHMEAQGYQLGDQVSFLREEVLGEFALQRYDYVIVGFVNSPEYLLPSQIGTSTIGDGVVDCFGILSRDSFIMENVSLARLKFANVQGLDSYSQSYKERMQVHAESLSEAFADQPELRYYQYRSAGTSEIAEADSEISEAEEKLQAAKLDLLAARIKLNQGWEDYHLNEVAFSEALLAAEKEISLNESKLQQAKLDLAANSAQLTAGQQAIAAGKEELAVVKGQLLAAQLQINDGQTQINEAQKQLDIGYQQITVQKQQVTAGLQQVNSGLLSVENGLKELAIAISQLNQTISQVEADLRQNELSLITLEIEIGELNTQITQLETSLSLLRTNLTALMASPDDVSAQIAIINGQINAAENQRSILAGQQNLQLEEKTASELNKTKLLLQQAKLNTQLSQAIDQRIGLLQQKNSLNDQGSQLNTALIEISLAENTLRYNQLSLDKEKANFKQKLSEYEKALADFTAGQKALELRETELTAGQNKLLSGQTDYEEGIRQLAKGKRDLASQRSQGEKQLTAAYETLQDGEFAYHAGLREYKEQLPDAREKIADGQAELSDAKKQLARLKVHDYVIRHRYQEEGFFQYVEDSESLDLLSYVFPVFFFLIALLVSLTTMTRMVDEQRIQLGTLKALGYTNGDVFQKYLIYGSITSLLGSFIGIIGGQRVLMPIIFTAYSSNFLFTEPLPYFSATVSWLAVVISFGCTSFAAYLTTRASLKNKVATLLRPKTPKSGNRILLERLPFVWQPLSFFYKVTARNIFRYKKRMLMTIIGVAGCTALIFMGFGIRDSVAALLSKQYGELFLYDTVAVYDDLATTEEIATYTAELRQDPRVKQTYRTRFEQGSISIPNKLDQNVVIVTPEDETAFRQVNQLRQRNTQEQIALGAEGAVITEKLAYLLGLQESDRLEFMDDDGNYQVIEIAAITENYAGHYIYLSVAGYEKVFASAYQPNSDFIVLQESDESSVSSFAEEMLAKDIVLSMVNINLITDTIEELMAALNVVVLVIILASSLLSIVVLYNLTNINVMERYRELSTIKVLGFYPREVTIYIYRETWILTALGILIGYLFGWGLHRFIVLELPPSNVLLDPAVNGSTYWLATFFTTLFSFVVMLVVHNRLKNINMVEALKAVE